MVVKKITKEQAIDKCRNTKKCKECQLNYKHWCIVKNTDDQLQNYLSKKDYDKYMNLEVVI